MTDPIQKLSDPRYFIETFFWIIDKERKRIPLLFNYAQEKYYKNQTHYDLILKARKQGFSTLIEAVWLHSCLTSENTRAVIISQDLDSTKRHFDRIKYFLNNMDDTEGHKVEVELDEDSQKQLKFPETNSSFWIGTAGAKAFGRGADVTHLHISEAAHFQNQEVLTAVLEACIPNAYRVLETTANGVGEVFYQMWQEAVNPDIDSPWKPHFFAWYEDPTNRKEIPADIHYKAGGDLGALQKKIGLSDEACYWYERKKAEMPDKALMVQEHPSNAREAFIMSGRPAFDQDKLDMKRGLCKPPMYVGELFDDGQKIKLKYSEHGKLKIWKTPRQDREYLIVSDVGEGVPGGDYSVSHVLDRHSWEQVAVWRGHLDPGDFGRLNVTLGYYYNNAQLLPELNNHGWATIEAIKSEEYPHLVNTKDLWPQESTNKDGWPTNEKTRAMLITAVRNSIDDDTGFINDLQTIDELIVFVLNEKTNRFEAQKGFNDDCVISYGIGMYALKHLTLDETYADRKRPQSAIMVESVTGRYRKRRGIGHAA